MGKIKTIFSQETEHIRKAYDLTVEQYKKGIHPFKDAPDDFKSSLEFKTFMKDSDPSNIGSNAPENKEYLIPEKGMRFLDAGCGANLANYQFHEWPSVFFGVDISVALIDEMKRYVNKHHIQIGGLYVAEIVNMPFEDSYFDIALLIGVLEYYSLQYTKKTLEEMYRVLKPNGKLAVDIANLEHPHVNIMFKLEAYLNRPNIPKPREDFEKILNPLFMIDKIADSKVMLKYFVRNKKNQEVP